MASVQHCFARSAHTDFIKLHLQAYFYAHLTCASQVDGADELRFARHIKQNVTLLKVHDSISIPEVGVLVCEPDVP